MTRRVWLGAAAVFALAGVVLAQPGKEPNWAPKGASRLAEPPRMVADERGRCRARLRLAANQYRTDSEAPGACGSQVPAVRERDFHVPSGRLVPGAARRVAGRGRAAGRRPAARPGPRGRAGSGGAA